MLKLFIDADGCPVKEECYRVAARHQMKVFVVANKSMKVPLHPSIEMVTVKAGADEADNWIAEHIDENDLCVTSDIPLADRCLKKGAKVLDARGEEFTDDMIGDALATRTLMKELREQGLVQGGPAAFSPKDRSQFLNSFERLVQAIKRKV